MGEPGAPDVPEALLVPLLDAAVDALRDLEPEYVPTALRPMLGWDRRGLTRSAARAQLLRAHSDDEAFRAAVDERFLARPEAAVLADRLDGSSGSTRALAQVTADAIARGDEGLVASVLYAGRPPGWEYGLGIVVGHHERERGERTEQADRAALSNRVQALEEALRRAEVARDDARTSAQRLDDELRAERRSRRSREEESELAAELERRRNTELERALAAERVRAEDAGSRAEAGADRARVAEVALASALEELAGVRAQLVATATALQRSASPGSGLRYQDLQTLFEAASTAEVLGQRLAALARRARDSAAEAGLELESEYELPPESARTDAAPDTGADRDVDAELGIGASTPAAAGTGARPAGPRRRARVPVPPGMVAGTRESLTEVLAAPSRVAFVIDGYNVAMRAWPEATPAAQRDRLVALASELSLRSRIPMTVVFDGADVEAPRAVRRDGVRVVFSEPGEEADDAIVLLVGALPLEVPVVVVSSDRELQDRVGGVGALAVEAGVLLDLARR